MEVQTEKSKKKKKPRATPVQHKTSVVIPYIEGVSEAVARVYKRHGISAAMRPHTTIRNLLVHPKDKVSKEDTAECVYRIPCKNCQKVYIGETGRSLGVRMKEHRKEAELHESKKYVRSTRKQSHQSRTNLQSQTTSTRQIAQLSQRDHAAEWVSFGQKWKTETGRQYFADIIGISSTTVTKLSSKAIEIGEKTQNKGYYALRGHSKSSRSVSIESLYATSY